MARPREPARILELRGAFRANPQRRREDAPGAGPFNAEPPEHLHPTTARAWRYLVPRLPRVVLTASDEPAVEAAARVLGACWELESRLGPLAAAAPEFSKLHGLLLRYLAELGLSPRARASLTAAPQASAPSVLHALKDDLSP